MTLSPSQLLPPALSFLAPIADELSGGLDAETYHDRIRASYDDLHDYYDDLRAVHDQRHPAWPRDLTGMDRWMRDNPGPALRHVHALAGQDELGGEDGVPTAEALENAGWSLAKVAPERPGMAACEVCGNPLDLAAKGRPRRTCSDACRKVLSRQRRASLQWPNP